MLNQEQIKQLTTLKKKRITITKRRKTKLLWYT